MARAEQPITLLPTVEELVDHLGPVEADLQTPAAVIILAKLKKAENLRKLIREKVQAAPDATVQIQGKSGKYTAVIGPRSNETKIVSLTKVFALVKKAPFLASCSLTLKALETLIPDASVRSKLTKTERTGSRSVETFAVPEPAQERKAA